MAATRFWVPARDRAERGIATRDNPRSNYIHTGSKLEVFRGNAHPDHLPLQEQ